MNRIHMNPHPPSCTTFALLRLAKRFGLDYWFAIRCLGWTIDERTGSVMDHFHTPDGRPVYRFDY